MKKNTQSWWQSKLPFLGGLVAVLVVGVLSSFSFLKAGEFQKDADWIDHTHQIRLELSQTLFLLSDAQTAVRGFAIAANPSFLAPYERTKSTLPASLSKLKQLTANDPDQVNRMELLNGQIASLMDLMHNIVSLRGADGSMDAMRAFIAGGEGEAALQQIRSNVIALQEEEARKLVLHRASSVESAFQTRVLLISGTVVVFLALAMAYWMLHRTMTRRLQAELGLIDANKQLVSHADQLEMVNKELESFSYSVSHDLRIPLRAVAGYAAMLSEDYEEKLDSEGKRLLNVILENSKRMGLLIDDLLTFSKLGRQALNATEIDMGALIERVLAEVRGPEDSENTEVIVDALPSVWGDRALLRQVWINLISNALKYSRKNQLPQIHISGSCHGAECVYLIRDNGVGFDMQYYNKLFGVFQRLHSAEEFPGTGVGLAIVQRITQRHGGRVWAEGAINQGATFFIALPYKENHDQI